MGLMEQSQREVRIAELEAKLEAVEKWVDKWFEKCGYDLYSLPPESKYEIEAILAKRDQGKDGG